MQIGWRKVIAKIIGLISLAHPVYFVMSRVGIHQSRAIDNIILFNIILFICII